MIDGRVLSLGALFIQDRNYIRLAIIPENIDNPDEIDRFESIVFFDKDRDPAFRLVDSTGQVVGETIKFYLVGPDADEVVRLLSKGKYVSP